MLFFLKYSVDIVFCTIILCLLGKGKVFSFKFGPVAGGDGDQVQVYTFSNFPSNKTALHMPCEESNMFATKCMCHIRCTTPNCENAIKLCDKYKIRGGANNRFTTLKRVPTAEESARFDVSNYAHSMSEIHSDSKWKSLEAKILGSLTSPSRKSFNDMVKSLQPKTAKKILKNLFQSPSTEKYCPTLYKNSSNHQNAQKDQEDFLRDGISLVALSYKAPKTLLNSMKTWKQSGLLDAVTEKILILNDPSPEEYSIALEYGFRVIEPNSIPNSKMSKPNVFTISAAFYYALQIISTDYLLFLENDFKMDVDLPKGRLEEELLVGAGLLQSGIQIIRLQSRKYQGCGTFKDCEHHGIHLGASTPAERTRNWFAFYCKGRRNSEPYVSDCSSEPDYRCFTSWDTNWTLNAVLIKKSTIVTKKYKVKDKSLSIAEIAISQWEKQDGLESIMIYGYPWQEWRVPICISYHGLFLNEEIETEWRVPICISYHGLFLNEEIETGA
eukprot:gene10861-11838_t